jgi:NhaP-type Na+/H+ or K+/H+ antiporter
MIRVTLSVIGFALLAVAVAWFAIPSSTYVEDALGILLLALVGGAALGAIIITVFRKRRKASEETRPHPLK